MAQKTVLIRKYENRRLYDATESRYVKLQDVARMLKSGMDVRVVDAASGKDITRLILTQIIVENAKTPDSPFPLDLLRQMIIASGQASQETALRYMKTMLDFYQDTYRAVSPAANPFELFWQSGGRPHEPAFPGPADQRSERGGGTEETEVGELKKRVVELEKLVSSMNPKRSSPKAGRKSTRRSAD